MKPIHIDLGEVNEDFSGQWVEVRNPLGWTKRRVRQWESIDNADDQTFVEFMRWLVVAWHVTDQDSGTSLNDPQTDDIDAINAGIVMGIREGLKRPFRGTVATGGDRPSGGGVADGDPGGPASTG